MCRRFANTLSSIFVRRPKKMEQCSETSAHKIQTPGNHQKEEYNIHVTAQAWIQVWNFATIGVDDINAQEMSALSTLSV